MNVALLFGRKNSKSIKNKNILKIFSKEMFMYPIDAAKKSKFINKIYVSSDSNYILKKAHNEGCEIIYRPKYLCNDKALLEDAIQHAVNYCQNKNNYLIKILLFFYVTLYVNYKEIDKGFNILVKNKNLTLLQQFLNLIISLVRSKKIKGKQLLNYITNSTLKDLHHYHVIETKVFMHIIVHNHLQFLGRRF